MLILAVCWDWAEIGVWHRFCIYRCGWRWYLSVCGAQGKCVQEVWEAQLVPDDVQWRAWTLSPAVSTHSRRRAQLDWVRLELGSVSPLGQWTVDTGQWTVDCGQWTLDSGLWTLGSGHWTVDTGQWIVDSELWTVDTGHWTVDRHCRMNTHSCYTNSRCCLSVRSVQSYVNWPLHWDCGTVITSSEKDYVLPSVWLFVCLLATSFNNYWLDLVWKLRSFRHFDSLWNFL